VNRLQAIAHVRKGASDDDAHRIVEVGGFHLLDDGDGSNVTSAGRRLLIVVEVVDRRFGGQERVL
jgi:hypothetical protein